MGENSCSHDGCPNRAVARGLCSKHYEIARTQERLAAGITCSVDGCEMPPRAKGLCNLHYSRLKRGKPVEQDFDPTAPRGVYRNAGSRTTIEEREAARSAPRPTCKCGCGQLTEFDRGRNRWRKYAGRDHYRADAPYKDADWLRQEYGVKGRTAGEIGEECGVTESTVLYFLRETGIAARSQAESLRLSGKVRGPKNPAWAGGTTPERQRLYKTQEWKDLVKAVYERDGYRCQRCQHHQDHGEHALHAHHIATWAQAPDRRTDMDNLITLCRACHTWVHSNANPTGKFLET